MVGWWFYQTAWCARYLPNESLLCFVLYFFLAFMLLCGPPPYIGGGRILRRTLSVRLCLSVRPVILTERHVAPPSELQWHTCTFRHALRAAYRTAISAAQILVIICFLKAASLDGHIAFLVAVHYVIFMRPSSLGGAAYCVALDLSVCPSVPLSLPSVTSFRQPLASCTDVLFGTHWGHPYFLARTEGRISYGHLGRTNSCFIGINFV